MKEYISLPDVPDACSSLMPNEWNKKQATLYFNWLIDLYAKRVEIFKEYFNLQENPVPNKEYVLQIINKVCNEIVSRGWFSEDPEINPEFGAKIKRIANKGYSISIDCAFYFLSLGETYFKKPYEWVIYTKYPKNYRQRNLPHILNPTRQIFKDPQSAGVDIGEYGINHLDDLTFLLNIFRNLTGVDSEKL